MFEINGSDYTLIVAGVFGALLFFIVQLILCFKAKKIAVKLIPLYLLIPAIILMIADFAGLFEYSGVISAQGILAVILVIFTGIALIGDTLAWVVYGIRKHIVSMEDREKYVQRFGNE